MTNCTAAPIDDPLDPNVALAAALAGGRDFIRYHPSAWAIVARYRLGWAVCNFLFLETESPGRRHGAYR